MASAVGSASTSVIKISCVTSVYLNMLIKESRKIVASPHQDTGGERALRIVYKLVLPSRSTLSHKKYLNHKKEAVT